VSLLYTNASAQVNGIESDLAITSASVNVSGLRVFPPRPEPKESPRVARDHGTSHLWNSKGRTSASEWTQANPDRWCRCGGWIAKKRACRNPRCSLKGHAGWSFKLATVWTIFLASQPGHVRKYFGTLHAPPTDHVGIVKRRKAFTKLVRKRWKGKVWFVAVSEVGPISGTWHDHYLMLADGAEVSPSEVLSLWRTACGDPAANVHRHELIEDVQNACRYVFKSDGKYHEPTNSKHVRLLAKGTPNLTWGSRFFPEKERETIWRERYPADPVEHQVEHEHQTPLPAVRPGRREVTAHGAQSRPSPPGETRPPTPPLVTRLTAVRTVLTVPPGTTYRRQSGRPAEPQEQGHSRYRGPSPAVAPRTRGGGSYPPSEGRESYLAVLFRPFSVATRRPNRGPCEPLSQRGGRRPLSTEKQRPSNDPAPPIDTGFVGGPPRVSAGSRQKGGRPAITPRRDRLERPVSPREPP
jgi:hypothetical protein